MHAIDTIERPGVVLTALSGNHLIEALGFIESAQQYTPDHWPIAVYSLAEDLSTRLRPICRVEHRPLPQLPGSLQDLEGGPYDPRYLTNSAWKPLLILDSLLRLPTNGILIYGDASTRITAPLSQPLLNHVSRNGFLGRLTIGRVAHYTHPATFHALGGGRNISQYLDVPMVCGCTNVWVSTRTIIQRVVRPWVACAMRESCIRPPGASGFKISRNHSLIGAYTHSKPIYTRDNQCRPGLNGQCHRGDQSVLSILLHDTFGAPAHKSYVLERHYLGPMDNSTAFGRSLKSARGTILRRPPQRCQGSAIATAQRQAVQHHTHSGNKVTIEASILHCHRRGRPESEGGAAVLEDACNQLKCMASGTSEKLHLRAAPTCKHIEVMPCACKWRDPAESPLTSPSALDKTWRRFTGCIRSESLADDSHMISCTRG